MKMNRKNWLTSAAFLSIIILAGQLLAGVGFAADSANSGLRIAIVQMGDDENSAWATRDIESKLEEFIQDDPFIKDRIIVYHADTLERVTDVNGDIIIYISHGGKNGLMTGDHMTTWEEMAKVVMDSDASIHLFAACKSKEIIKYGEEKSEKHLYTVPSVRAAEVTNVEIATIVMLADGVSTDIAEEYRNTELMKAKQLIESGKSSHPLDFDEIILTEIDTIETGRQSIFDDASENPSDDDERFLEFYIDTSWAFDDYSLIPQRIRGLLEEYYPTGTMTSLSVTYRTNYYTREFYEADPEPVPDWYPDPTEMDVFTGCTYSGEFILYVSPIDFTVRLTASGDTENGVDSIALEHVNDGGVYVIQEKESGIWQSPIVGRNRTRSGGSWVDSCSSVDYEYDSNWPYRYSGEASGTLRSNGEYLYVTDIPSGYGWHGPSFVRTLPSYFKLADLDAFSSNMSILQDGVNQRMSVTCVSLYDENEKMVISLQIYDNDANSLRVRMRVRFFREDESYAEHYTDYSYGDYNGVVTARYEPLRGVVASVPGKNDAILFSPGQINPDRLIKYAVIQSYRRYSYSEHDERIHQIQLSYAGSEYTVFNDNCNDMDGFHENNDFGWGVTTPGEFVVPDDQSYMRVQSIPDSPSGWHGPNFVHVLDRPFRLYQLSEFSVMGQLVQSSNTKGATYVGLFDENKQIALVVMFADAEVGIMKGYFKTRFYSQNGAYSYQSSGYIYNSGFTKTGRLWWGEGLGGDGAIYSSIDGSGDADPIGECDNASRVIKYVALRGVRYSGNSLVDMRIHDITVIADVNALPPDTPPGEEPEPEEYDGTDEGRFTQEDLDNVDSDLDDAMAQVDIYWTGPWPLLHYEINAPLAPEYVPEGHPAKEAEGTVPTRWNHLPSRGGGDQRSGILDKK